MILFLIFSMFHLTIFLLYFLENVSSNLSTEFFTSAITVLIPKNSNSLNVPFVYHYFLVLWV